MRLISAIVTTSMHYSISFLLSILIGQRCHKGCQCHHHGFQQGSHQLSSGLPAGLHQGLSGSSTGLHQPSQKLSHGRECCQLRKKIGKVGNCQHLSSVHLAKNFHVAKLPVLREYAIVPRKMAKLE